MSKHLPLTDDDGEVRTLTAEDMRLFRPASEVLPEIFGEAFAAEVLKPKSGRPRVENPKAYVGIRLDADVVNAFRATGKGWQTRMNGALKEWLRHHSPDQVV